MKKVLQSVAIPNISLHENTFYITNSHLKNLPNDSMILSKGMILPTCVNIINYMLILLFFEDVRLGIMVEIAVRLVYILILELVVSKTATVVRTNVIFRLDVQVSGFVLCQYKGKDMVFIN